MKHMLIGTAGHVDHGKTALIRALTGIDADRLQEEKSRGITIDLGFAHMTLKNGDIVSIVDVPGHEKFIKNMLAGAGGMDLVLLVIAADDGVMPQTREHLGILQLLNIKNGIIVLTKCDLVEDEWQDMICDDIKNAVTDTFLQDAPILRVSSQTGAGIEDLKEIIHEKINKALVKNTTMPFRIPIDRVFSSEGFGTVITGTLIEGSAKVGDKTMIFPEGITGRIRNLQVHGHHVDIAYAGQRVAVNLSGIRRDDILRGHVLAQEGSLKSTRMLDVKLSIMKDSKREIVTGSRLHFHAGTQSILCKLSLIDVDKLTAGQSSYAQIRFADDVSVKVGDNFVVRFYSPLETIGGGTVLNTAPKKYRKSHKNEAIKTLVALEKGDIGTQICQAIVNYGGFCSLDEIRQQFGFDTDIWEREIDNLINQSKITLVGDQAIEWSYREMVGHKLINALKKYHKDNPLHQGMGIAELRSQLLSGKKSMFFDELIKLYNHTVRICDGRVSLHDFQVKYTPEQKKARDAILTSLINGGYTPPTIDDILSQNKKVNEKVYEALLAEGTIISTEPGIIFAAEVIKNAKASLSNLAKQNDGSITLAQFRDEIQTSRKFALSLLEYFDRCNFTRKLGDSRVLYGQ